MGRSIWWVIKNETNTHVLSKKSKSIFCIKVLDTFLSPPGLLDLQWLSWISFPHRGLDALHSLRVIRFWSTPSNMPAHPRSSTRQPPIISLQSLDGTRLSTWRVSWRVKFGMNPDWYSEKELFKNSAKTLFR